jgi:hypothetical protein
MSVIERADLCNTVKPVFDGIPRDHNLFPL